MAYTPTDDIVPAVRAFAERCAFPPPFIPTIVIVSRHRLSTPWPDAARYLCTAERGEAAAAKLHFPGLHPEAARWLVANRTFKTIGIDTASIDSGQSWLFESLGRGGQGGPSRRG